MIVAVPVAVLAALSFLGVHRRRAWAERDIRFGMPHWLLAVLQISVALPIGVYVGARYGIAPAAGVTAFAWLAVLATISDIVSMRIPREACNAVSVIGIATFAFSVSFPTVWALTASVIAAIGGPAILRILTNSGLGFSDIRLLTAAVFTLSWWVGETTILIAFIAATFAQQAFRIATLPWRRRIGEWEPALSRADRRRAAQTLRTTPGTDTTEQTTTVADAATPEAATPVKQRRALPFGPALAAAFLIAALYSAISGVNVFTSWMLA